MKQKKWTVALLLAALLLVLGASALAEDCAHEYAYKYDQTKHWQECTKCGLQIAQGVHSSYCNNPNVCITCEAKSVTCTVQWHSNVDYDHYQYDENQHWRVCLFCKEQVYADEHYEACNDRGVCMACHGENVTIGRVSHQDQGGDYQYDDNEHWYNCSACGEEMERGTHGATCATRTQCDICSAENVNMSWINHEILENWTWEHDDTAHWKRCGGCGEAFDNGQHWNTCEEQDVCAVCGETDVTFNWMQHDIQDNTYQHDDTRHWQVCSRCKQKCNESNHYETCDQTGVCGACGETDVTFAWTEHDSGFYSQPYQHDEKCHWRVCPACGKKAGESEHWENCQNPGVCADCGATEVTFDWIEHNVSDDYQHDEDYHWQVCSRCKQKCYESNHYETCDQTGVCRACGETDVTFAWTEHGDLAGVPYQHDREWHYQLCPLCNQRAWEEEHYEQCSAPGVCAVCGAEDVNLYWTQHKNTADMAFEHDSLRHWRICPDCGEKTVLSSHAAFCSKEGVCYSCGASDVVIAVIEHTNVDWNTYQQNETAHWHVCGACGSQVEKNMHQAACTAPDVCASCGAARNPSFTDDSHVQDTTVGIQHDETYHWTVCAACGEHIIHEEHTARCDEPGVCSFCGASGVSMEIRHTYEWGVYQHDENTHWNVCTACEEPLYRSAHTESCTKAGICSECGAENVNFDGMAHTGIQWLVPDGQDATKHWWKCTSCGEAVEEEHYASCVEPGVCAVCRYVAADDSMQVLHMGEDKVEYDAEKHWTVCGVCGETINRYPHYVKCDDLSVCDWCGYTGDIARVIHNTKYLDFDHYDSDANYHWQTCAHCGEKVDVRVHQVSCDKPGVCTVCGASCKDISVEHKREGDYQTDGTAHWYTCATCGKTFRENHFAVCSTPGVCNVCEKAYDNLPIVHASYRNEDLLVTETTHTLYCPLCEKVITEPHKDVMRNGSHVCTTCDYVLSDALTATATGKYTDREVGQPNRYYATAQGGTAPYTYYFRLYKDGVVYHNSGWITEDNYRIDFTEAGTYTMTVKVQDAKGNKSDWVECAKTVVKATQPLTATATGKYTDREVGQPNRYYATAQGGTAPYTYYFRLYKDGAVYHNSGWIADDNYRIDFTEAGTYTMTVKVQDAKGNKTDWVECAKTVVKAAQPLTATATGKYTEREPGQPNRYYATAQGGTAPYTYYFRLYKDGAVYNNSGWITEDNYRIDFAEAGTYTMTVKVQDAKGNKSDWVECAKTVVKESAAVTAPTVKVSGKYTEREPGQPNRYYATAQGGTAPYTYYFRLYKDGVVYHNSDWITADNYRIDFTETGTYTMTVKVQDAKGNKSDWVYCTQTVVKASAAAITPTVKVSGKYTDREVGQPNRYYATAQGGTAPYTYYFRLYKDGVVYHNSGWIADDNYRIDFTEAGTYTMTVKVQDANGNKTDWVSCGETTVAK